MAAAPDTPKEVEKHQFDYAWKWFCFHADQRIKMFNFMLVVFGIFAAGIVNSLDKHLPKIATVGLCVSAAILALLFALLDRRNRDLVWLGEDVLMSLERTSIFGDGVKIKGRYDKDIDLGILSRQALEQKSAGHCWIFDVWLGKHRVLLPMIALLIAALFALTGLWIALR